ncbi:hypothetical protein BHE74_00005989 [Ensete ventricosum]|nr:hypothetical protein BHE74_00005989 [Ensete ventricosum]
MKTKKLKGERRGGEGEWGKALTERDVEDEEGIRVSDVWRPRSPEVRHREMGEGGTEPSRLGFLEDLGEACVLRRFGARRTNGSTSSRASESEEEMGSRLGRRVIHFANLPIKLLLPSPPFDSIREIALKTIPSASKVEIRRVLESLYGFDVADVRTLNMEGKKTKRGPFLAAKPDYKKAYVTLRSPLSLSPDLFPVKLIFEERERIAAAAKAAASRRPAVVEGEDGRGERKHWLDERRREEPSGYRGKRAAAAVGVRRRGGGGRGGRAKKGQEESKFPWSSMRLSDILLTRKSNESEGKKIERPRDPHECLRRSNDDALPLSRSVAEHQLANEPTAAAVDEQPHFVLLVAGGVVSVRPQTLPLLAPALLPGTK